MKTCVCMVKGERVGGKGWSEISYKLEMKDGQREEETRGYKNG
jgi:hypothetical protein